MLLELRREGIRLLVLAIGFAAPVSLAFAGRSPILVAGIWLVTVLTLAAAPRELWLDSGFGVGIAVILFGAALAWFASVISFFGTFAIVVSHSLCGDVPPGAWWGPALVVYGAGGSWALAGSWRRALLGWPAAVVLAAAIGLAAVALLPGAHGYCET